MMRLMTTAALAAVLTACGGPPSAAQSMASGAPEETRPPNAAGQHPAFAGQTRAPRITTETAFQVVTVAKGLDHPWGLAILPDGRMLVTEKAGRLRLVGRDGTLSAPLAGVPQVDSRSQGGLLGLALDPKFAQNQLVYISFSEPHADGTTNTAVMRGRLAEGGGAPRLENTQVIFQQAPPMPSAQHYGGRLAFAPDGSLFVTTGDRFIIPGRMQAQKLDADLGKIIRINPDGSIPKTNPFVGKAGARPEIWSYGHRNVEAAAINPWTHRLWTVEHGARGGDEVNIPAAGKDYGWPTITYGEDYSGQPIGEGITQHTGMEQPVYYWDPVLAPSGMAFYTGSLFPAWKGSLFVGGLASQHLARLTLKGDRVVGEEWLLGDLKARIRDVVQGPDGALYLLTDSENGKLLKLAPK
jgi:glucose/arabinose dehydrogenase